MTITIKTNLNSLLQNFKQLEKCMSTEEVRYYLKGVSLKKLDNSFRAASTDGHKLCKIVLDWEASENLNVILPDSFIKNCIKIKPIRGLNPEVTLEINETAVTLTYPGGVIKDQLIDGNFPDIERVYPSETNFVISFNASYLKDLCESVLKGGNNSMKININTENNSSPIFITDTQNTEFLLMPIRF